MLELNLDMFLDMAVFKWDIEIGRQNEKVDKTNLESIRTKRAGLEPEIHLACIVENVKQKGQNLSILIYICKRRTTQAKKPD